MSVARPELLRTIGFRVADAKGRVVGTVEAPMYGSVPDVPDAISEIDIRTGVIGLSVDRDAVLSFL